MPIREGRKAVVASRYVPEALFRYPGPRPQTPEAGILTLADVIEAALRACQPASHERMTALVTCLIENRWLAGELEESELEQTDLSEIQAAFQHILQGVYHVRVTYPSPIDMPSAPIASLIQKSKVSTNQCAFTVEPR